jgi:hypothetical protein
MFAWSLSLPSSSSLLERRSSFNAFHWASFSLLKSSSRRPGSSSIGKAMSKNAFQLSRWIDPVNVVISLSTRARKTPAIGKSALLISSMRRSFDPASATIAAARSARPSLPFGVIRRSRLEEELHVQLRERGLLDDEGDVGRGRLRRGARRERREGRMTGHRVGQGLLRNGRDDQARLDEVLLRRGLQVRRRQEA